MHILLVCTGNTCRSPMAEEILRRILAERGTAGVRVSSAGTGAWDGAPASEGAYLVALEHGLDLSSHRAKLLTRDAVQAADLILVMTRHHHARVEELDGGDKTYLLGEYAGKTGASAEVSDPFGGAIDGYRRTFTELQELLPAVAARVDRERLGDRR